MAGVVYANSRPHSARGVSLSQHFRAKNDVPTGHYTGQSYRVSSDLLAKVLADGLFRCSRRYVIALKR
jgi:hypothetical protein